METFTEARVHAETAERKARWLEENKNKKEKARGGSKQEGKRETDKFTDAGSGSLVKRCFFWLLKSVVRRRWTV